MNSIGCEDILTKKYGPCPITYHRSHSDPIDCCFGYGSLQIKRGGCLSFGRLVSDHRGLCMDISNKLLYGFNPPPLSHPSARRLKMKDPRCIQRYNEKLHQDCEQALIYYKMDNLHQVATDPMTEQQQKEYEEIDGQLCKMMECAEPKCRRSCVGSVA